METSRIKSSFSALVLLFAVMCMALPVTAASGTITIAYRGSGGNYIGDTIIFDGKNTVGNTTMIRIAGPGLPSEGVPLYDLSGIPGSGNTANVNADGLWTFSWDSSRSDTSKLQTARYTFIASDLASPEKTATTSILLKKPEFYITAKPSPVGAGDYVELQGMAERGVTYVKIDVSDASGTISHTFIAPVSGTGFFQYGFHVDMKPGQYNIVGTNPSMKNSLLLVLTVAAPLTPSTATAVPTSISPPAGNTGSISISSAPPDAIVYLDSAMKGKTPVTLDGITAGTHVVEIKMDGYLPHSESVDVKSGETATVNVVLQKAPSQTGIETATIVLAVIVVGAIAILRAGWKKK